MKRDNDWILLGISGMIFGGLIVVNANLFKIVALLEQLIAKTPSG